MRDILVIDTEPRWLAHCKQFADTCQTLEAALALIDSAPYKKVIVSSTLMDFVPRLAQAGAWVEVATAQEQTAEAVAAYRAGACAYWQRDYSRVIE